MANLIITIISIALVAVATIVGAYYGGIAFQNYQMKAQALAVGNKMSQVAAAIKLWEADTGQNFVNTYYTTAPPYYATVPRTALNNLIPKYFQNDDFNTHPIVPTPSYDDSDVNHAGDAQLGWQLLSASNPYSATPNDAPNFLAIAIGTNNLSTSDATNVTRLCRAVIDMARGSGSHAMSWSTRSQGGQFDCEVDFSGPDPEVCVANNCRVVFYYKL